ncbi:MAG: hypothetical protein EOP05_18600 [Proteobacteria bacterium]|nr:MAG: hypothetical protein EOP05_18600 [Pseudomonadota bacterium]
MPGNKDADANDLRFKEFKNYLTNALVQKGFTPTDDATKDYLVITLAYGVGDAEKSVASYSVPVYGFGGMAGFAGYGGYGYGVRRPIPSPIMSMPVSYNTVVEEKINYTKFIVITAYENTMKTKPDKDGNRQAPMTWQTRITSKGESSDLREYFPIMLAGALDKIGTNTGKAETKNIKFGKNDRRICEVKFGTACDPATGKKKD